MIFSLQQCFGFPFLLRNAASTSPDAYKTGCTPHNFGEAQPVICLIASSKSRLQRRKELFPVERLINKPLGPDVTCFVDGIIIR